MPALTLREVAVVRFLTVLLLFATLLPLAPAQQPPPAPPPGGFDADAVVREVNDFYAAYWKAWNDRNLEGIAASLAPDFKGFLYLAPQQGVGQMDKPAAVAGVRQFFEAVRGQETLWSHSLLSVIPRSPTEAMAAVRNDFSLLGDGGEVELTLEVLRKDPDGRWRLVRKWSEKRPF